jgi:hypothetical protein
MISTEAGIQMNVSAEHVENAFDSIWRRLEPDSNVTDFSDRQPGEPPKHSLPITSTDAGMQIDSSAGQHVNSRCSRT